MDYDWPGNVRELENVIERASVLGQGDTFLAEDVSLPIAEKPLPSKIPSSSTHASLAETEKRLIEKTLRTTQWNQSKAAKLLKIHRNTLQRKIRHFNIHKK